MRNHEQRTMEQLSVLLEKVNAFRNLAMQEHSHKEDEARSYQAVLQRLEERGDTVTVLRRELEQ